MQWMGCSNNCTTAPNRTFILLPGGRVEPHDPGWIPHACRMTPKIQFAYREGSVVDWVTEPVNPALDGTFCSK